MGNILWHGVNMYQQTINQKPEPQEPPPTPDKNVGKRNPLPESGGLIKTGKTGGTESKLRRVAKLLILLGGDQAAKILAELDPEQVEEISREIAQIKGITPEESQDILAEFRSLFSGPYRFSGVSQGGIETARRILYAAKGPEKGEALLNKAVPDSKENIFTFMEEFSPEQLVMVLKTETPQTTALILSRLSPKLSAQTLGKFLPDRKAEVLRCIAHQKEVLPEVLERVAGALKEKVRHISGGAKDIEIDGMQRLAAILKQGDYSFGDRIINELEQSSPDIGKDLKEKLYTLDDVVNTVDRPLQEKLTDMPEREIAILLKGKGQEFREKILSCVSAGRRQQIREESEILGAVPKRDCDEVAGEFLEWFRSARESGKIILYSDEDVYL